MLTRSLFRQWRTGRQGPVSSPSSRTSPIILLLLLHLHHFKMVSIERTPPYKHRLIRLCLPALVSANPQPKTSTHHFLLLPTQDLPRAHLKARYPRAIRSPLRNHLHSLRLGLKTRFHRNLLQPALQARPDRKHLRLVPSVVSLHLAGAWRMGHGQCSCRRLPRRGPLSEDPCPHLAFPVPVPTPINRSILCAMTLTPQGQRQPRRCIPLAQGRLVQPQELRSIPSVKSRLTRWLVLCVCSDRNPSWIPERRLVSWRICSNRL